ncbi:MAG TPA: PHP domain-containing protein, partial [Polyangia bacterium]
MISHRASDYVELRCRSAFTFLDGATLPEDLVARAAELGYSALALTDRDGVYGAPRFFRAAGLLAEQGEIPAPTGAARRDPAALDAWVRAWPMRPILGAELSLAPAREGEGPHRLTVLVENREGYRNLCRLITRSRGLGPNRDGAADDDGAPACGKVEPQLTLAELAAGSRGLIALTGNLDGAVGQALERGDEAGARCALDQLIEVFGADRLYAELGRHLDPDEELRNQRLLPLARRARLPLLATNDVRYARPDDRRLYDVLTCVRHHATVDEIGRRLPRNGERWLKPPAEMARLFSDLPEAIHHTREVAERCAFTLAQLGYKFPSYPLPPGVPSEQAHLEKLTWSSAATRFQPLTEKARAQLARELQLIGKLELAGYFLIVWDLVAYCRTRGILVQGRGSAANSAVCYALGITAVDPVKMELLFERFLTEERGEWPDIDLDLPSGDEREEVIQYVYKKYGRRGAAMTANVITYRPKMAVRDAGRALGFSEVELARMSSLLSSWGFQEDQPEKMIERQLAQAGFSTREERTRLLVELSGRMLDLPRHLGQHSGGMVIAEGRLDEVVPLEPASMPGRVVVQWDKDDCADLGIVKVDLLGLGMMAVLEESVALVRAHEGQEVDLAQLPPGDPAVYEMLQKAD